MASYTFLARDLFGGYWGTVMAALIAEGRWGGGRMREAMDELFGPRREEHAAFLARASQLTGLPAELLEVIDRESPWAPGLRQWVADEENVLLELSGWVGRLFEPSEAWGAPGAS